MITFPILADEVEVDFDDLQLPNIELFDKVLYANEDLNNYKEGEVMFTFNPDEQLVRKIREWKSLLHRSCLRHPSTVIRIELPDEAIHKGKSMRKYMQEARNVETPNELSFVLEIYTHKPTHGEIIISLANNTNRVLAYTFIDLTPVYND